MKQLERLRQEEVQKVKSTVYEPSTGFELVFVGAILALIILAGFWVL